MELTSDPSAAKEKHHERFNLCRSRPQYRQGRKLTAVKVYSVVDESKFLLIHGVPAIAVTAELKTLCLRYGSIEYIKHIPNYPAEKFCEVYQVKFHHIQSARFAKRKLDDKNFYGGVLHVCYAPELEAVSDILYKLNSRKQEILKKLKCKTNPPSVSSMQAADLLSCQMDLNPNSFSNSGREYMAYHVVETNLITEPNCESSQPNYTCPPIVTIPLTTSSKSIPSCSNEVTTSEMHVSDDPGKPIEPHQSTPSNRIVYHPPKKKFRKFREQAACEN